MVCDEQTEQTIWWEKNGKLSPQQFDVLLADFLEHAKGKQLFAQDLYGGADPKYRIKARVFTELAWHSLFIRSLLIRPERARACRATCPTSPSSACRPSRPIRRSTACAARP